MTGYYHVCFVVPDLDRATTDLTRAAGVRWSAARDDTLGDWPYRIVFSVGAPYLEIIEGAPGSPWDATDGPRFDHLGWWTRSVTDTGDRLAGAGFPAEFDGCAYGRRFAYHRVESIGARIEIVDLAAQAGFLRTWDPAGVPPPPMDGPPAQRDGGPPAP